MEKNKKKRIMMLSLAILLVVSVVGVSYAYFTANLSGGETATTIEVNGGVMSIVYADHNPIIAVDNIIPDNNPAAVKSFTVTGTNSTDLEMGYGVSLVVNENTFSNGAISYKLESTNSGSNGQAATSIVTNKSIKTGEGTYKLGQGYFTNGTGKVHSYELKIYFLETGNLQNEDQGKTFKAHVGITDASSTSSTCNVDLPIGTPIQIGDNAYVRIEENFDITIYGTGATWDSKNSVIQNILSAALPASISDPLVYIITAFATGELTIEIIDEIPAEEIESFLEKNDLTLTEWTDLIENIDSYICGLAFSGKAIIEEGITVLGSHLFENAGLTNITLPNSLQEIGQSALQGNKLTTLLIPEGVTSIGKEAVVSNQLTTLIIPASVTNIGSYAFDDNPLITVTVLGANPQRFNSNWDYIGFQGITKP